MSYDIYNNTFREGNVNGVANLHKHICSDFDTLTMLDI